MNARKLALLHALTSIAANGPTTEGAGICFNVLDLTRLDLAEELSALIEAWPESGGCTAFPVEGSVTGYLGNRDKWNLSTEYGAKRYRLLAFLIHELSKEYHADQGTS